MMADGLGVIHHRCPVIPQARVHIGTLAVVPVIGDGAAGDRTGKINDRLRTVSQSLKNDPPVIPGSGRSGASDTAWFRSRNASL